MKRNRIVINFDNHLPGAGRSRRRRGIAGVLAATAIILVLIVAAIAGGGFFWWRHYQNSPAYSLALLVDAIQRNDKQTIDQLLDTDKIATNFVSQIRDRVPAASLWLGQIDSKTMSPKLKDTLNDQLIKQVQQLTDAAAGKPFMIVALAVPHFADIKEDTNSAQASVNLKDEQIQLTMVRSGNVWRINAVQDDKLARMIAQAMISNLPANAGHVQGELQRQLNSLPKRNR
jgi:flagellar basal body-associated protein FliL